MRFAAFLFLIFFISHSSWSQQSDYTAFTVKDGLPSNYVYRCIEDDKGFLWVATDAGIARFDGKHFQIFTTQHGLPDNEVLAVIKENNGRIWVNCFKQSPAYFDEVQNRFINAKDDSTLANVKEGTLSMYSFPLQNGGVMFVNEKGSFILRDKKLTAYYSGEIDSGFLIKENKDGTQLKYGSSILNPLKKTYRSIIYEFKGSTIRDSVIIKENNKGELFRQGLNDGKFYMFSFEKGKCFIYSNISNNPIHFKVDSISVPEPFNNFEFTSTSFYLLGLSGKIYLFNKKTLSKEEVIEGNYLPNSLFNDSKGNLWISTIDKGLLLYQKRQFDILKMPDGFTNTNFLSIARKANGEVLAGNFYGEVIEVNGEVKINTINQKDRIARQRKILHSQNKIFTFSETGVFVNYTRPLKSFSKIVQSAKTAIIYNDSIIIVGLSSNLNKLNSITEKITPLNANGKRITALTKGYEGNVYFGSTDGLYKYLYSLNTSVSLNQNNPLLSERITALCTSTDNLLWVATSGSGVVVVHNDKVLLHISEKEGIINNASRSITSGGPGQIWLGTSGGISVINYTFRDKKITYNIQNLTVNDGLSNNVINEMLYQRDTIYAATGKGISVIPANISLTKFNITVHLRDIRINQRDTILASNYKLSYHQQNIQMQFAGVELGGHFRNLEYTLDKNENWVSLNENNLTVQFSNGVHTVNVRAVDVNGNISNKILSLQFDIATPFWKTIWFWLIIYSVVQVVIIYLVNLRQKKRKETKLAKEIAGVQTASLEQQAFTSLMNPHFIFNALNSIQHYINVQDRQNANRYLSDFASLIRKNFEASQQSFIPLEQEIENIKIYLRLEQMRFNDRFSYKIRTDENLDTDDWMIPTMILQPLLENALLHGMMPSSIKGKLLIELKQKDRDLVIIITDNGIGIANSLALKENGRHRSMGMELIKKRIEALSRFGAHAITIKMSPAFESKKNPGNKIILFIPVELHQAWLKAQQK